MNELDIFNPQVSTVAKGLEGKVILVYGGNNLGKTKRLSSGNRLTSYLVLDIAATLLHMHRRRMDTFHQRLIKER